MPRADTRQLQAVVGRAALHQLVQLCGGLVVDIPKRPPLSGALAALPADAQAALCQWAGGDAVYIPKCDAARRARRDADIRAAYDAGRRVPDIAREHGLTERWVYAILGRAAAADDAQGALF